MNSSDSGLLVLHALRLKGFVETDAVAEVAGLAADETARRLTDAAADGYVNRRDGARSGWSLTTEGRKEGERLLADELDASGLRAEVRAAYDAFRLLNPDLLAACTAWQVIDPAAGRLNDHTDEAHDRAVVARLREIDRRVRPICAVLGDRFERFGGYGPRFRTALDGLAAGDPSWFTGATIDSYHTVWFELHEDLLATLGLDRASERSDATASEPT